MLTPGDEVVFGGDTDEMREAFRYLVEEVGGSTGSSEGSLTINPFISDMLLQQQERNSISVRQRSNCQPPAVAAHPIPQQEPAMNSPPIQVTPAAVPEEIPKAIPKATPAPVTKTQTAKGSESPSLERKESVSHYSGKALDQVLSGGRVNSLDMLMSAAGNVDSMVVSQQQLEKLFGSAPSLRNKKKPSSKEKKSRLSQAVEATPVRLSGKVLVCDPPNLGSGAS